MAGPKAKVARVQEQQEDIEEQQKALDRVADIQRVIDELNEQASEEILKVEQKYNQARRPHFAERGDVLRKIPEFWTTTLLSHPSISELMGSDDDEDCLQHLVDLIVEEYDDVKSGYKITFIFRDNPYFENDKLTKEFTIDSAGEPTSIGTDIVWKAGMDLVTQSNAPGGQGGRKRPHEDPTSFFAWFSCPAMGGADEIGEIIKDDIWNNPLQYYLAINDDHDIDEEEEPDDYEEEDDDEEP